MVPEVLFILFAINNIYVLWGNHSALDLFIINNVVFCEQNFHAMIIMNQVGIRFGSHPLNYKQATRDEKNGPKCSITAKFEHTMNAVKSLLKSLDISQKLPITWTSSRRFHTQLSLHHQCLHPSFGIHLLHLLPSTTEFPPDVLPRIFLLL